MLPCLGYFQTYPCVFYVVGDCGRPHCHYRHSVQDIKCNGNSSEQVIKHYPITVLPSNFVGQPLVTTSVGIVEKTNFASFVAGITNTYDPTPIKVLNHMPIPIACASDNPSLVSKECLSPQGITLIKQSTELDRGQIKPNERLPTTENNNVPIYPKLEEFMFASKTISENVLSSFPSESNVAMLSQTNEVVQESTSKQLELHGTVEYSSEGCRNNFKTPATCSGHKKCVKVKKDNRNIGQLNIHSMHKIKKCVSPADGTNESFLDPSVITPDLEIPSHTFYNSNYQHPMQENCLTAPITHELSDNTCKHRATLECNMIVPHSTTVDPFTRWSKNVKLKNILEKTRKAKNAKGKTYFSEPTAKEGCLNTSTKMLNKDLPSPRKNRRNAHKPNSEHLKVIISGDTKLPLSLRQFYCKALFNEFIKIMTVDDAEKRAVSEEFKIAINSKLSSTYKNRCSLLLVQYRIGQEIELIDDNIGMSSKLTPASSPGFAYGWSLHQCFSQYLLNKTVLISCNYPFGVDEMKSDSINKAQMHCSVEQSNVGSVKLCEHCGEKFEINSQGFPTTTNDCFYHWGKLSKQKGLNHGFDAIFTCCLGLRDADPCIAAKYHVWSRKNENSTSGYVKTPKLPSHMKESDAGIYALDCEMCYTTNGLELARLTVVNVNEDVVFDQVVSLKYPVLDFCTRFSGIDENKIQTANYSFEDVQKWVLDHFYDKTILIGHSLENDLNALKLIHHTIIDTSVTYPHSFGLPHKMSLKRLASTVLNLNIQQDDGGHDSKEDAVTCLKLVMKKIKEDSKSRKPRIIIGYHGKKK